MPYEPSFLAADHRRYTDDSPRMDVLVTAVVLILAIAHLIHAETYQCRAGDVSCLRAAIHSANANGGANTITLAPGTYTLTAIDNRIDGANGLPSITSPLTIRGAGAGLTILERDRLAPALRLIHVAATGTLTLEGLTLQGGTEAPGGGLIHIGGLVNLVHSSLVETRTSLGEDRFASGVRPLHPPRITETDLTPPQRQASSPLLQEYLTLVQRRLQQATAAIPQSGLADVTLAIRRDGSVMHIEVVQRDGPSAVRAQLLPIVESLGPWPPPPVDVEVLMVTVMLPSHYPGADLLDHFGTRP